MEMLSLIQLALLWFSAIGCAVIGGVYFTFSTFVMTALGRLDGAVGLRAMQSINDVILRSLFMPLFFGTTLASVVLAGFEFLPSSSGGTRLLVWAAAIIHVVGMFVVTMVFNVPLNNELASARGSQAAVVWGGYLKNWTGWNHVRTVASIAASALYIVVLVRE